MLVLLTALQELEVVTGTGSLLAEATRMASMTFRVSASYVLLFTLTLDVGLRILSNKYLYLKRKEYGTLDYLINLQDVIIMQAG